MINISHYCATSDIKPEIARVLVKKEGEILETVATDSYRLAIIKYHISEPFIANIEAGLYPPTAFKHLCVVLNKKSADVTEKLQAVKMFNLIKDINTLPENYPDYKRLIETDNVPAGDYAGMRGIYNVEYLLEHLELSSKLLPFNKYSHFNTSDQVETSQGLLKFKIDTAILLLMQVRK